MDPEQLRKIYNRVGRLQDTQTFYERRPVNDLLEHLELPTASRLVEIGCGTGKLAARLVQSELPNNATYQGFDISDNMVRVATKRLRNHQDRVEVTREDITNIDATRFEPADRIISTYVLDLLTAEQTEAFFTAARSILAPGGLLGVVSLTTAATGPAATVSTVWGSVAKRWPQLLGGCRPIDVQRTAEINGFVVDHHAIISAWGVPSEVATARPA